MEVVHGVLVVVAADDHEDIVPGTDSASKVNEKRVQGQTVHFGN